MPFPSEESHSRPLHTPPPDVGSTPNLTAKQHPPPGFWVTTLGLFIPLDCSFCLVFGPKSFWSCAWLSDLPSGAFPSYPSLTPGIIPNPSLVIVNQALPPIDKNHPAQPPQISRSSAFAFCSHPSSYDVCGRHGLTWRFLFQLQFSGSPPPYGASVPVLLHFATFRVSG